MQASVIPMILRCGGSGILGNAVCYALVVLSCAGLPMCFTLASFLKLGRWCIGSVEVHLEGSHLRFQRIKIRQPPFARYGMTVAITIRLVR